MIGLRLHDQKIGFWLQAAAVVLIIIVAAFFRFYRIAQIPPGLFPDEATHALDALEVLDGQITIYSPDEGSTGALWRYLLAVNFALLGPSILSLRVFSSAVGVLSVGMAYLVVREMALAPPGWDLNNRRGVGWAEAIAILSALLLAVSYWHLDLSRMAFSAVLMLLVQDATFFCLWRALNSGRQRWFALFGLGLGLLVYNYLPGKLVPAVPLVFFLLQWLITRSDALVVKYWRPLLKASGVAMIVGLPFVLFALFNYETLIARAAVPTGGTVAPPSSLQGTIANLAVFGLWPTHWLSGQWEVFFLGPILTVCFVIGVGVSLIRVRQAPYLFLLVWWLIMLLPGALAPEGAVPHARRAIGIATVTFALASLGLATLVSGLILGARSLVARRRKAVGHAQGAAALTFALGAILAAHIGADSFRRYFVQWGPSEAAKLTFHVYDLELADLMERQSGAETVYLLPLDSAAGSINPLLDSITFVYQGQASYDFLSDNEQEVLTRLAELTAGKQVVRVLRWKVSKHTGADPKELTHYYLEKWGRWVDTNSYPYFDLETYELDDVQEAFSSATLTPAAIDFEGEMTLTHYAAGDASGGGVTEHSIPAGDLLWAELAWCKTGNSPGDYQVALWLEDQAGHEVGRVDKKLLNNLWHRGASEWTIGDEERDYYLLQVDPTTPSGTYRLKMVLYDGKNGQRLAPAQANVGADLAMTLGDVIVRPPSAPPDVTVLPIPQRLDQDIGGGLDLLGFDPGFARPLRPGERAVLSLWWQVREPPLQSLAVNAGIGQGERDWPLSDPQPLGGTEYPTHQWPADAVIRTFVDLRLPPELETGDFNLVLHLLDADSGTPLADWLLGQMQVTGRTRTFEIPPMTHRVGADFDGQVTLVGYDLDLAEIGKRGPAKLILYWQAQAEMETAYVVFVHLLDEAQQIVTQVDQEPQNGEAPTTGWLAGEVVSDEIEVPVSEEMAGVRSIAVGLYDPFTGKRVPVLNVEGVTMGDHVTLPIH
jgi:hypothetical protein